MDKDKKKPATAVSPEAQDEQLLHTLDQSKTNGGPFFTMKYFVLLGIVIVLGIGTGYMLSQNKGKVGPVQVSKGGNPSLQKGQTFGKNDEAYKDTAEGVLNEGGIDGEGQFHLTRPGGESQNVYITSSNIDLSQFIRTKIKVWGQTQKAQKAGWLMDVGKVEVLE